MSNEIPQDEQLSEEQLDVVAGGLGLTALRQSVATTSAASTTRTTTSTTTTASSVDPTAPGYITIAAPTRPRTTVR